MAFITQGDAYALTVLIKDAEGLLNMDLVEAVEFTFGSIRKVYPDSATYDPDKGLFSIPLTQQETFQLMDDPVECQVRVKFYGGNVCASGVYRERLNKSLSKVVL